MKRRKILIVVVALLMAIAVGGRLYARHAALSFGRQLLQTLSVLGSDAFADTAGMRDYFARPHMAGYSSRVRQLSFLGGRNDERLSDLQSAMIYYSEQASLPPEKRFAAPPALKHLTINTSDRSDKGLVDAVVNLIMAYASQI